ncbi:MAG: peptidylprolyl isomerase, partial [Alphaproteobacteria bacterium]|nr:peptidylprolyl isomerase [Alphaproteobacteria bacterium]
IEYATVKYSEFNVGAPTDEQLQAFYAQNPQVVPETRSVSYVLVPAEMTQPDKYDAAYNIAVKVEDDIIAGDSMKQVATKHGAKYVDLGYFAHDSRPVDKVLSDTIVAKIFDMEAGVESEMIETKDGFLFLRVDESNPAHTAKFEDVKKSLVADWKKAEQKKQAYVRANEMLVDLNKGEKLAGKKSVSVSRASGAPANVLVAAFRNEAGQNLIVDGNDAFYVLSVKKAVQPKVDAKKKQALQQELEKMSAAGLMDDYNSFLMREYPIKINDKVYNRLFAK